MSEIDLIAAKDAVVNAVLPLRETLMQHFGNVENELKHDSTVVTKLDTWAEEQIKKSLLSFDSSIGFLGEEFGADGDTARRWVIDPIDGTENFIRGIAWCGNMVCLVVDDEVVVSVIYMFPTDELYWAVKGGGAWLGDKKLSISQRPLSRSLIETSFDMRTDVGLKNYLKIKENTVEAIRLYASCQSSVLVASGAIEGRVKSTKSSGGPWDYAPGSLLVQEAGGHAEHLGGKKYNYSDTSSYVIGTKAFVEFTRTLEK